MACEIINRTFRYAKYPAFRETPETLATQANFAGCNKVQ